MVLRYAVIFITFRVSYGRRSWYPFLYPDFKDRGLPRPYILKIRIRVVRIKDTQTKGKSWTSERRRPVSIWVALVMLVIPPSYGHLKGAALYVVGWPLSCWSFREVMDI